MLGSSNLLGLPTEGTEGFLKSHIRVVDKIYQVLGQNQLKVEYNSNSRQIFVLGTSALPASFVHTILYESSEVCRYYQDNLRYPIIGEKRNESGNLAITFSYIHPDKLSYSERDILPSPTNLNVDLIAVEKLVSRITIKPKTPPAPISHDLHDHQLNKTTDIPPICSLRDREEVKMYCFPSEKEIVDYLKQYFGTEVFILESNIINETARMFADQKKREEAIEVKVNYVLMDNKKTLCLSSESLLVLQLSLVTALKNCVNKKTIQ